MHGGTSVIHKYGVPCSSMQARQSRREIFKSLEVPTVKLLQSISAFVSGIDCTWTTLKLIGKSKSYKYIKSLFKGLSQSHHNHAPEPCVQVHLPLCSWATFVRSQFQTFFIKAWRPWRWRRSRSGSQVVLKLHWEHYSQHDFRNYLLQIIRARRSENQQVSISIDRDPNQFINSKSGQVRKLQLSGLCPHWKATYPKYFTQSYAPAGTMYLIRTRSWFNPMHNEVSPKTEMMSIASSTRRSGKYTRAEFLGWPLLSRK
jgi:hypothetical protein